MVNAASTTVPGENSAVQRRTTTTLMNPGGTFTSNAPYQNTLRNFGKSPISPPIPTCETVKPQQTPLFTEGEERDINYLDGGKYGYYSTGLVSGMGNHPGLPRRDHG